MLDTHDLEARYDQKNSRETARAKSNQNEVREKVIAQIPPVKMTTSPSPEHSDAFYSPK